MCRSADTPIICNVHSCARRWLNAKYQTVPLHDSPSTPFRPRLSGPPPRTTHKRQTCCRPTQLRMSASHGRRRTRSLQCTRRTDGAVVMHDEPTPRWRNCKRQHSGVSVRQTRGASNLRSVHSQHARARSARLINAVPTKTRPRARPPARCSAPSRWWILLRHS